MTGGLRTDSEQSSLSAHYVCAATGQTYPLHKPLWRSPNGGHLNLSPGPGLDRSEIDTNEHSLWRYAAAIRVPKAARVSMGEGWTPLLEYGWRGRSVRLKLDFLCATGSFKDRGSAVLLSYLKAQGVPKILEDSSGNAGASLAAYAASAGIACRILVPASTPRAKIAQMKAVGAEVILVEGSRQDVAAAALEQANQIFYASHNWQPMFLEGTKTLAYELWEQLDFRAPDAVVVPLGYGSNVLGCAIGFDELFRRGHIRRIPRIYGIQAKNCAPFYSAFKSGRDELVDTAIEPTVAEGIASSRPVRVKEVLGAMRESGGAAVAVSETQISRALSDLARSGLFVEPTSATAIAGLDQLLDMGLVRPEEATVVVLTGSGLKATDKISELLHLT